MSLKMFHIVFILLSIATAAGFGAWAIQTKLTTGDVNYLYMGVASLSAALALLVYFFWFLAKIKRSKL